MKDVSALADVIEKQAKCIIDMASLIDGVYETVFMQKPQSTSQVQWKRDWLAKAKKFGAGFDC